jgi:hypothetical protein
VSNSRFKSSTRCSPHKSALSSIIEAVARGDEVETRLLTVSALRDTYTETDAAFTGLVRASAEITELVCSSLLSSRWPRYGC